MSPYTFSLFAALTALSAGGPAMAADSIDEREALARLAHEVATLAPLIDAAKAVAKPGARVRFRYDWLRRDLARVREGLLEHAHADQAEPRQIEPLRGDYRR